MTRQRDYRSTAAGYEADDLRQGWLFPKEELLSHGVLVTRYGDSGFGEDITPRRVQIREVE